MSSSPATELPALLWASYALPTGARVERLAGGTAGRAWRVRTEGGDYFLRLRGERAASRERIAFDHAMRAHLLARGVKTAMPLPTVDGAHAVEADGGVYELYPFVDGRAFDAGAAGELASVARELARFHEASRDFMPPSDERPVIAQYAWLGLCDRTSTRLDDPELQLANITRLKEQVSDPAQRAAVAWAERRADRLRTSNGGELYDRHAKWVLHGDFTPANVLMDGQGGMAGIFDLDWALADSPRVRDIGDALYFFAAERDGLDFADIWSLTAAAVFDKEKCRRFLEAYESVSPLDAEEREAIPAAFEGRWLSIRLEGMKKVAEKDRLHFFDRGDLHLPVQWLDEHWPAVIANA